MTPDTASMAGAIESLEAALCASDSPRTFAPLAEAYRLAGRLDDALRAAERGAAAFPAHVGIAIVLARTLTDLNDFERAREAYVRVLRLDPGNLEALSLVGTTAASADEHERSGEDSSEPAVRLTESSGTDSRAPTASLDEELSHLDDLFVSPAHRHEPTSDVGQPDGIATLTLAEIYSRQGLRQEAVRVCEAILERQPENEEARRALDLYLSQSVSV
ncbi:MAG: tetratricopeptide repeat protein [Candidatus Eisenbacteria bacterium]|nr:tetratricopeptide repeat protein [Candidatus Eisenbacteria bacterium]